MRAAIEARQRGSDVSLVTKGLVRASHTRMSGGRYNALTGQNPEDSHDIFFQDTISGGADVNNQKLARVLVREAYDRALDLEAWGLVWERAEPTKYQITGAGGGTRLRMFGSFDEGIGITEVMIHMLIREGIEVLEQHMLIDVHRDDDGTVVGALTLNMIKGSFTYFQCGAVVIAAGGTSQLYATNSGPSLNTGDGIAVAIRAGAELVDIEFMQFIPISFVYPPSVRGYTLTEPPYYGRRHFDINGEPGKLLNAAGERFVAKHDPVRMEGSTRDILARAIMLELLEGRGTPEGGVWLEPDPAIFEAFMHERPIYTKRILENYGERAARFQEPLQVMPSALYTTGGIRIDEWGRTTVQGLFAAGEAAGGVHGANRLGASSMPDIQVFGRRAGISAAERAKQVSVPAASGTAWAQDRAAALSRLPGSSAGNVRPVHLKKRIQKFMLEKVGLVRDGLGLQAAQAEAAEVRASCAEELTVSGTSLAVNREWMEAIELGNLLDVAEAMMLAGLARTETRGSHYRQDYPARNDAEWLANLYVWRADEKLHVEKRPLVEVERPVDQVSAEVREQTL